MQTPAIKKSNVDMIELDEKNLELLEVLEFEGLDLCLECSLFDYNFLINKDGVMIVFVEGKHTIKTYGNKDDLINDILDIDDKTLSNILDYTTIMVVLFLIYAFILVFFTFKRELKDGV